MSEIFHQFVDVVVQLVGNMGYFGIFLMMTLESSFVPFPSEIVLIPAGFLVKQGQMNAVLVVVSGILGSLAGALINYYLSATLGRKFILQYGKYFLLNEDKFLKIEKAFLKHGNFATFVGRLIFGIRQWISIPAGLSRMPFGTFASLTALGAGIWVVILVSLGYVLGNGSGTTETAKLVGYWLLGAVLILSLAYYYWWVPKRGGTQNGAVGGCS